MKQLFKQLGNVFNFKKLTKNNINNNTNNKEMEDLGFVINGLYVSHCGKEVINVLGESDIPNIFDVLIKSSTKREKFNPNNTIKISEFDILNNYDYRGESSDVYRGFGGGDGIRKDTIKLSDSVPSNIQTTPKETINVTEKTVDSTIHTTPKETINVIEKTVEPTQNFNTELVNKILKKHTLKSDKTITNTLHLNTNLDMVNILKAVDYMDVSVNEFMDILFENNTFISALKISLLKSFTESEFDTKIMETNIVTTDTIDITNGDNIKENDVKKLENLITSMRESIESKIDLIDLSVLENDVITIKESIKESIKNNSEIEIESDVNSIDSNDIKVYEIEQPKTSNLPIPPPLKQTNNSNNKNHKRDYDTLINDFLFE